MVLVAKKRDASDEEVADENSKDNDNDDSQGDNTNHNKQQTDNDNRTKPMEYNDENQTTNKGEDDNWSVHTEPTETNKNGCTGKTNNEGDTCEHEDDSSIRMEDNQIRAVQ